jgi:hypothetical protein
MLYAIRPHPVEPERVRQDGNAVIAELPGSEHFRTDRRRILPAAHFHLTIRQFRRLSAHFLEFDILP